MEDSQQHNDSHLNRHKMLLLFWLFYFSWVTGAVVCCLWSENTWLNLVSCVIWGSLPVPQCLAVFLPASLPLILHSALALSLLWSNATSLLLPTLFLHLQIFSLNFFFLIITLLFFGVVRERSNTKGTCCQWYMSGLEANKNPCVNKDGFRFRNIHCQSICGIWEDHV